MEKKRGRYSYQRHGKQLAKRSRSWWDQRLLSLLLPWPWLASTSFTAYLLRLFMRRHSHSQSLCVSRFVPCVGIARGQDVAWRIYAHDDAFDVPWREWCSVSERMCILWFSHSLHWHESRSHWSGSSSASASPSCIQKFHCASHAMWLLVYR